MSKYNCIIVEDEPLAADILVDYIRQVPFLEFRTVCPDALYAADLLKKEKIDLVFLDIHLPRLKGMEFLESLDNPPAIIIISAYREYALQGYEHNVLDYLLKPVRFNRFLKAVNRLKGHDQPQIPVQAPSLPPERSHLFFNVGRKKVKIFLDEILYIESLREYIKINTAEKSILTKFQLSEIEQLLSNNRFVRIHRSFIVARDKISAFTATDVEINNVQIPIARSHRDWVLGLLEQGQP